MMVRLLLLGCIAFFPSVAFTKDLAAGHIELSGESTSSFGATSEDYDGNKLETDYRQLSVEALYYIGNNFGIGILYGSSKREADFDSGSSTSTSSYIGPKIQYNISVGDNVSMKFLASSLSGSSDYEASSGTTYTTDLDGWEVGVKFSYFFSDYSSIDAKFSRTSLTYKESGGSLPDSTTDSTIDQTSFGMSLYFP